MNPANEIKKEAHKYKKSYWGSSANKGKVINEVHNELQDLENYKQKCTERRNNKNEQTI